MDEITQTQFMSKLKRAGKEKAEEILFKLSKVEPQIGELIKWIYAYSPLSDMASYDFSLFEATARHGALLLETSPFVKEMPRDIFLSYVLHPRVGGEQICNCRKCFYDLTIDRIKDKSMYDAIIELNYFNAENVMYTPTDFRTLSALGTYNSAFGRCGEEAVFAVNVFRSVGIPARQVYTPRWAHCDDNHAWVEVMCDGKWRFLGACEPEEILDKGWFNSAAYRALFVTGTRFGPAPGEEIVSRSGPATFTGSIGTYAEVKELNVTVKDEHGPVQGARVTFGILNASHIFPAVTKETDKFGKVTVTCGKGTLFVRVTKDDISFEKIVLPKESDVEFELKKEVLPYDKWVDLVAYAPEDGMSRGVKPTEEQKKLCAVKTAAAGEKRRAKAAAMYNEDRAKEIVEKYGYSSEVLSFLKDSYGNFDNIASFLCDEAFTPREKEGILSTILFKDLRDVDIEVLKEAIVYSRPYASLNEELYFKYIMCPRVWFEYLTVSRKFISEYFTEEQKRDFRAHPIKIWQYVCDNITWDKDLEYGNLITVPIGALMTKSGNNKSQKILFVAICRTLGIPARLNPINGLSEYHDGKEFVAVEILEEESGDSVIVLEKAEGENYAYMSDFGIAYYDNGSYIELGLDNEQWNDNKMRIPVKNGEYRIITDNRLPNGNLYASEYHFKLAPGEEKHICMHKYEAQLKDMLYSYELENFLLKDGSATVSGSDITPSVLIWIDEGAEPTEHLFNEMLERKEQFEGLDIRLIAKKKSALDNAKLRMVIDTFGFKLYYDESNCSEPIARRLFLDPERLPLVVVTDKPLNAIYAYCGYNVGGADMIYRVSKEK